MLQAAAAATATAAPTETAASAPAAPTKPTHPQKGEAFADTWARLGGEALDNTKPATAEAEGTADAETEVETTAAEPDNKPPAKSKPTAADNNEKLTQLKALATELGLEVDAGRVAHSEYKGFRDWKAKQITHLREQEQELIAKINAAKTDAEREISGKQERLTKAESILAKFDAGDYEGFAQALGKKNWEELQDDVIAKNTDPNYRRVRELEAWKAEQEQKEQQALEEAKQRAQNEHQQRARANYRAGLITSMKGSKHPLVREMHDDPIFVSTIMGIQEDNWDGTGTVTPEQALRMVGPNGKNAVLEHLRDTYQRLHRAFGELEPKPTATPEKTDRPGVKPRPKSSVVSTAEKETSPPAKVKLKSKEWDEQFRKRLADAIDDDRRAEEAARRRA